jgi:acyl carrier protein
MFEQQLINLKKVIEQNEDIITEIDSQTIVETNKFKEDLGLDSMAMMSLSYELQELLPQLDDSAFSTWVIVSDCLKDMEQANA